LLSRGDLALPREARSIRSRLHAKIAPKSGVETTPLPPSQQSSGRSENERGYRCSRPRLTANSQSPSLWSILGANFTTARCGRSQFTPARFWRVSQPLSAVDKTGNFGRSWRATRVGRTLASRELPTPSAGDAQPRTGVPARTEPSEGTAPLGR